MKTAAHSHDNFEFENALPRHLIAMFPYVNRGRNGKCVDATFVGAEVHLDRLAAAARMQ